MMSLSHCWTWGVRCPANRVNPQVDGPGRVGWIDCARVSQHMTGHPERPPNSLWEDAGVVAPSGIVAFLSTDLEDSTRPCRRVRRRGALLRPRPRMSAAIEMHRGR